MQNRAELHDVPQLVSGSCPDLGAYDADIVILAFNNASDTENAIASALNQRGGTFHVIVLDQGTAPEATETLIKRFRNAKNFSLYRLANNSGVPAGRNLAAALGQGQIIISLDNDAEFMSPWVAMNAVTKLRKEPDIAVLGFAILLPDRVAIDSASWGYPASLVPRYQAAFDTTTFVGAGHAIRRSAWIAAGGYDPSLFFTWEEYDFALRAITLGWRIRYDGSLAVIHHKPACTRLYWKAERISYFVRNRLLVERKWGMPLWRLVPRMAGYLLQSMRLGNASAAWIGILLACRTPITIKHKMSVQGHAYLRANDRVHRGGWIDQLRFGGLRTHLAAGPE
jgi:GT2 family glycosyltransferase